MAAGGMNLEQQFGNFAKFGDVKSDGKGITLTNADKWMKQAKVIDGKKITTTDTGICFNKRKMKTLTFPDFVKYVEDLAEYKKVDAQDLKDKLMGCGLPGATNATVRNSPSLVYELELIYVLLRISQQAVKVGGVDRLTDTSKYTGSHKERFDESGKGKGIAGREDVASGAGYVGGYKNEGTYDKTH